LGAFRRIARRSMNAEDCPLPTLRRVSELAGDTEHLPEHQVLCTTWTGCPPSFGPIGWVRIRSAKRAKLYQHSLGIDRAAESAMLRELSGAPTCAN
jgi:hypothetical protein